MANGYIMIDCKEMDLLAAESQTIDGLYNNCVEAMASGKPIIATNCLYGEGVEASPIAVMGIFEDTDIIFTSSILQVVVSSDDSVVIRSLVAASTSTRSKK